MIEPRLSDDDRAVAAFRRSGRHDRIRLLSGELRRARRPTRPDELDAAQAAAETRLRRRLTVAERALDLVGIDRDLREGKARLAAAIDAEKRRAIRRSIADGHPVRLRVTPEMLAALTALYQAGVAHAHDEIRSLVGLHAADRSYADRAVPARVHERLDELLRGLSKNVTAKIHVAVSDTAVSGTIGEVGSSAVAAAVLRTPGALDVASRLVSTAMFAGIGDVYGSASGLFAGFQYSAVNDGATCDPCAEKDGTEYGSWEEAQTDLPDGGPNPDCDGDGRCRCRLVPLAGDTADGGAIGPGPADEAAAAVEEALPEGVDAADQIAVELARARIAFHSDVATALDVLRNPDLLLDRSETLKESVWVDARTTTGELRGERRPTEFAQAKLGQVLDAGRTARQEVAAAVERATPGIERHVAELSNQEIHLKAEFDLATGWQRKHVDELRKRLLDEQRAATPGRIDWDAITRAVNYDPENERLIQMVEAARAAWYKVDTELKTARAATHLARRDAVRDLLQRSGRKIGGKIEAGGSKEVAETLRVVEENLPTDWIETSNEYSARSGVPLRLRKTSGRAHYQELKYTKSAGSHSELLSQGGRGYVRTTLEDGDLDTAAHEFGHRMEHVDPLIKRLEWTFYQRRTNNSLEATKRIYRGSREMGREDRFVELYMGKDYGNTVSSYFELLSMGLEDLLFGVYGADEEYLDFILGLLVTI